MRLDVTTEVDDSAATRPARLPGLDGLRALAVCAVVLFHLGRLPGGNLGVDAFFVLSGWLISSRLLAADRTGGGVDLRGFWAARVRRLAPASITVIVVVAAVWSRAGIAAPSLRRDIIWALGSASNWGTITGGGDYWARFGEPSPLAHYWSLAVEEQFYLLWPALLFVVTRRRGHHRDAWIGGLSLGLAGASIAFMLATFERADPTATYMHSLARAHSLLIGVAAAALTAGAHRRALVVRVARGSLPAAVTIAAAVVLFSSERSSWLFVWGFPAFALAMAVIVVAVAHGRPSGLDAPLLRWLGERSYGIYLWHWPVILFLRGDRAPVDGLLLDVARVAVAVGLAAASYRWLEMPIRQRRLGIRWQPAVLVAATAAVLALAVVAVPHQAPRVTVSTVSLPLPARSVAPVSSVSSSGPSVDSASAADRDLRSATAAASPERVSSLSLLPTERPTAASPPVVAPPVRTLVVGDSTAVRLGEALLPYAADHPERVVAGTAAFGGCGLSAADDGRRHRFTNAAGAMEEVDLQGCVAHWRSVAARVSAEGIDVVLVVIGPWDGADIRLPSGATVSVLDRTGRRLVAAAYRRFVQEVGDAGARVLWVTPPDVHLSWAGVISPLDDHLRWRALRSIVDGLGVEQVDLPGWLRANGLNGPSGRPDGVHLAHGPNERFVADAVVPALLASASAPSPIASPGELAG